jgi:single-strand DNA-binding protein
MMINTYLGRLVFDVKLEEVGDNKKVLNNRIAMPAGKDKATFIDIVAWNGTAELINTWYKKGYEILLQGELIQKTAKKENVDFNTVAIQVEKLIFTNGNPKDANQEGKEFPDFLKS